MSSVTNVFLFMQPFENAKDRIDEVNAFFSFTCDHLVLISDEKLGWKTYGGNKHLESDCAVGALNHLDIEGFLDHLSTNVNWREKRFDSAQVLIRHQDDFEFTMHTIRAGEYA